MSQAVAWQNRFTLADVVSVTADPNAMRGSFRLCGSGGLFGFFGWFRNKTLGIYRAYGTDPKNTVVLKLRNRTIVVTPHDPARFVEEILRRLKPGAKTREQPAFHLGGCAGLHSVLRVLTEKPWRAEAIARLLVALLVCVFLGSLALGVIQFEATTATVSPIAFYALAGSTALVLAGALGFVVRPWSPDNFKLRAAGLLFCVYAGLMLKGHIQRQAGVTGPQTTVAGMLVQIVSFQGAAVALVWAFVRQHGVTLREGFGLGHRPGHAALLGAVVALGFIPAGLGLQFSIATLAKQLGIELPEQEAVLILRLAQSWPACIALGVAAIVIAPLAEESLFRGIFYPALKRLTFPVVAMWVTAVLFAVIHFNALSFTPLVALALALAWLYEKTDNLLAPVVCHATFNAFNFVMLFVLNDAATKPGP